VKRAVEWFARNGVAANVLFLLVAGGGIFTLPRIRREIFPEISLDRIRITVPYPGAAPAEVEEAICVRVEEAVHGLDGIKRLRSTAAEGFGDVQIELEPDADARKLLDEVKARVDAIDTFPEETEEPVVEELVNRFQVITVAVHGRADERTLKRLAERARDEISTLPGISQAELANSRPYEISVEVSEEVLRRHGLTFDEVARAVRRSSIDLPGGSVKTEGGEILLRSKGQAYRGAEFEDLVLLTREDGTRLRLGDVAEVVDGFADTGQSARFDGEPAVTLLVFRVGDQSALEVADRVKAYVTEANARMPEGVRLTTWQDNAAVLRSRLDTLLRNARSGFLLILLTLALFLRLRLALWVTAGMFVAFLGTIWAMPALDVSINLISLFAFIVVLGIVVDDAIVVGENVHTHQRRRGGGPAVAAEATNEVSLPVVFAVFTTIAAFLPMLFVVGRTGKVMRMIPLIVIPTLLFSLLESLFVLPSHLSHGGETGEDVPRRGISGLWSRFQGVFQRGIDLLASAVYRPALAFAVRRRYLTVSVGLATLLLTASMVGARWIRFVFFPNVEADFVAALLTMPQGTPAEVTARAVSRLEETARSLREEIDAEGGPGAFRHVLASIGEQPFREIQAMNSGLVGVSFTGAHLGEVTIELAPSEKRGVRSAEVVRRWRERAGPIADAVELVFTSSLFTAGEAIHVQLRGADTGSLRDAARELQADLAAYPGVIDVADSYRAGKQEIVLDILPSAEVLGLTLSDLARQVRQGFHGEEAQRIQRGRDDVKVMVRYPEAARRSLGDVEGMRVRAPDGTEIPFSAVARSRLARGYATIERVDRARAVSVTADVDENVANANEILDDLRRSTLPRLRGAHPGVAHSFEGQRREQAETIGALSRGFLFAVLAIYALLAIPLRSYVQPLLIVSAIPFGLVGAVWGHLLMGLDLTILSMFGVVALAGVVVNDSLVLVDFVNRRRAEGAPLEEAVGLAGSARFRPILLTSLTTFAGLTPLLLERSVQARFLIPMAVSLAFGVLFSTFITLLLVPAGATILEDARSLLARGSGKEHPAAARVGGYSRGGF